uniref:orotate phosphoribosyltransferase n=1 Tax=Angiostrongylus cantonensis TaxID=6313 RepID=A0A0K0DQU0_ANGCA
LQVFRLGEFYLKSGQLTPIYIDLRRVISNPRTLVRNFAQAVCDFVIAKELLYDCVVGVPYAALPLATHVSNILDVPMLMKRKELKSYGTRKLVEGVYAPGDTVLLIEDVVTTGDSIRETAEALREEGLIVTDAIAVLDRQQGAAEGLADMVDFSILTMERILDGMIEKKKITAERKREIIEHLKKPF